MLTVYNGMCPCRRNESGLTRRPEKKYPNLERRGRILLDDNSSILRPSRGCSYVRQFWRYILRTRLRT